MLFILPGALGVFQEYTILYYGEFIQYLSNYGIIQDTLLLLETDWLRWKGTETNEATEF